MDRIIIGGVQPFDGTYPLDLDDAPLTTLEWRWIKQLSGYLPLTINDGLSGGDPDLIVALAVIALQRGGKISKTEVLQAGEQLADVPFDGAHIRFEAETVEDDAGPPDEDAEPSSSSSGSGDDSEQPSENQANGQETTGSHASVRSVISGLTTSTT